MKDKLKEKREKAQKKEKRSRWQPDISLGHIEEDPLKPEWHCAECSTTKYLEEDPDIRGVFYCARCWDSWEEQDGTGKPKRSKKKSSAVKEEEADYYSKATGEDEYSAKSSRRKKEAEVADWRPKTNEQQAAAARWVGYYGEEVQGNGEGRGDADNDAGRRTKKKKKEKDHEKDYYGGEDDYTSKHQWRAAGEQEAEYEAKPRWRAKTKDVAEEEAVEENREADKGRSAKTDRLRERSDGGNRWRVKEPSAVVEVARKENSGDEKKGRRKEKNAASHEDGKWVVKPRHRD
eukprot:NODE_2857_length_2131_cov_4.233034.p1 GENE.NODE_2857_length_2131_cov_4.233034~~NODE_2857_length_2131_cov_4.233034.p1  ORF type:complete len:290 (+),score=106.66 NODE_2857_length_2131_cov_4.233034:560-1429(+)